MRANAKVRSYFINRGSVHRLLSIVFSVSYEEEIKPKISHL